MNEGTRIAQRESRQLTKQVVAEQPRGGFYQTCIYCGARTAFGVVCRAHRDLPQLEAALFTGSNDRPDTSLRGASGPAVN